MSSGDLGYITVQAVLITASSNVLAQFITAYRGGKPSTIDWTPVIQFAIYTLLTCPPNYLWQSYIERLLPGETFVLHPADETPEKSSEPPKPPRVESYLNIPNTIAKFLIDQSLCASVNTVAFITAMAYFKGKPTAEVVQVVQRDFWPLLTAGWRLWPVVSLTNYAVIKDIPTRTLVGNMAGVAWNVYLSLVSGGK